jgi:hypothetical protein
MAAPDVNIVARVMTDATGWLIENTRHSLTSTGYRKAPPMIMN